MKKRYIRANDSSFMNRTLRKAFMLRTTLKNRYNKNRSADNWDAFRRQRNFCVKLSRKVNRDFYNQLDISEVTDNKKFWKTVKPFISDKSSSKSRITLIEDGKIMSNESEVAETFNDFLSLLPILWELLKTKILFFLLKILAILLIKYYVGSQGTQVSKKFVP